MHKRKYFKSGTRHIVQRSFEYWEKYDERNYWERYRKGKVFEGTDGETWVITKRKSNFDCGK